MPSNAWYATERGCDCITAAAAAEGFDGQPISLAQAQKDFLGMNIHARNTDNRIWERGEFTDAIRARFRSCTHKKD